MTMSTYESDDEFTGEGALGVLRRGLARSPELRSGLVATVFMGLSVAVGRLAIPVLIQQAIDKGISPAGGVDIGAVMLISGVATVVMVTAAIVSWATQRRLVDRAEHAIANLRIDAFRHVHRLSIGDHNEAKTGVLVARVTSDAESLARFAQWGLYSWTMHPTLIVGTFVVLAWYSWVLAVVVFACYLPVIPSMRVVQRRQLRAYDALRTRVAEMLGLFSETVSGISVIKAYGVEATATDRLDGAIQRRYEARMHANKYQASAFVIGDFFGGIALCAVLIVGVQYRHELDLNAGKLVAAMFLAASLQGPISELFETMDQTQTAVAGWRKILNLLDRPTEIAEHSDGPLIAPGAITIDVRDVNFSYREGPQVLHDLSCQIAAGTNVAVVGETGSGKSTFAKLLCRLADPTSGTITLNGVRLDEASQASRLASVRMVPQDGFLFDTTLGENLRFGRPDATEDDIRAAFERLELTWWLNRLPNGLDTLVGERGGQLSVGERQLVALVRAALADPGLLILDEATSAVDPETDQALTTAIRRLAQGRTLISIAHRLATAEAADEVFVFDHGELVERGGHDELVRAGGRYARLHAAWVGNTQRG